MYVCIKLSFKQCVLYVSERNNGIILHKTLFRVEYYYGIFHDSCLFNIFLNYIGLESDCIDIRIRNPIQALSNSVGVLTIKLDFQKIKLCCIVLVKA